MKLDFNARIRSAGTFVSALQFQNQDSSLVDSSNERGLSAGGATIVAVVVFGALFFIVPPAWEWMDTDDPRMQFMVAGIGMPDGPESHVLYMNILLADVLATFYSQNPEAPWYGITLVGSLVVAWLLIVEAVFALQPARSTRLATLICVVTSACYLWTHLQFTIVATSVATAGLLQLLAAVLLESSDRKFRWGRVAVAWLLVVYSSLIREHACYLIGMVALPAALLTARKLRGRTDLVRHIGAALAGVVAVVVLARMNQDVYQRDAGWQKFREFERPMAAVINNHRLRSLYLSDGKIPFPEQLRQKHQQTLDEIGWSENDLRLFLMFCFSDADVYSAESLNTIQREMLESPWKNPKHLAVMLAATGYKVLRNGMFLTMLLLSVGLAVTDRSKLRFRNLAVVWVSVLLVCWLVYVTGKLPERVLVPASMAAMLLTVLLPVRDPQSEGAATSTAARSPSSNPADESAHGDRSRTGIGVQFLSLVVVALCGWQIVGAWQASRDAVQDRAILRNELEPIVADGEHFYVVLQPLPFSLLPPLDNNRFLSDWQYSYSDGHQRDPADQIRQSRFGIQNLTDAIASGRRVRIIGPQVRLEMLARFIEEHRQRRLRLRRISDGQFVDVYDVESEPLPDLSTHESD